MYVHVTSPRDLNYFNQNSALSKTLYKCDSKKKLKLILFNN